MRTEKLALNCLDLLHKADELNSTKGAVVHHPNSPLDLLGTDNHYLKGSSTETTSDIVSLVLQEKWM